MKYIVISLPGAADHPAEELGGKTPFEVSKIPNLNALTAAGKLGCVHLVPERLDPSADTSFLNLLGYQADKAYTGRGPLEAANLGIELEEHDVAFRMNFITESAGTLADATAGNLSTKEARALINFLNKKVSSDFVRFYPSARYYHVAVLKDSHGLEALSARTQVPDNVIGETIESNLPKGPGEELLRKLMYDARLLLQDHEINQVRVDLQENPANMIWLWGQGQVPKLAPFRDNLGLSGAVVASAEYALGIARLAEMECFEVTGEPPEGEDRTYEEEGEAVREALAKNDVVAVVLDACDEAARTGDVKGKIKAIEEIDFHFLSRVKEFLDRSPDTRVLITTAHATPWKLRRHTRDAVPFLVAGKNVMKDDIEKFSELTARSSDLVIKKNVELMRDFLSD